MLNHSLGCSRNTYEQQTIPTTGVFKSKVLPLHLTLTHTPLTVADADTVVASLDPGHLSYLSLVPTSFKTGSYGWKGNKRLTVELVGAEGGEVERVTVVLTCVSLTPCLQRRF
jgi:hypothetical protein